MYLTPVTIKESPVNGKGVFVLQNIKAGEIVWKFNPEHDKVLTSAEFDALDTRQKESLRRVAYLSKNTRRWIYPPENDPARYTNHSKENNISAVFDDSVSEEPFFVANRNIVAGEELTNNYNEFNDFTHRTKAEWLK